MFFRSLTALHGQVADLLVVRVVLKVHGARQQEGQPGKRGKQCAKITAFFPVERRSKKCDSSSSSSCYYYYCCCFQ